MICLLVFCIPGYAAAEEELPPSVQEILEGDSFSVDQASHWQISDILDWLAALPRDDMERPLRFLLQAVGYLLLAGALGVLAGGESWRKCLDAIAVLGFGTISLSSMMQLTDSVVTTAQDCQNYLVAFVPVYSGVAAIGGQSAGALVYSGMFFAISGFLAGAIENLLLPGMQIYFCFAACACVWGNPGIEEAARLFAQGLQWLLKLCGAVFSLILGVQNILAAATDNAALRTGKSVLQGFVPVVGDAAAAALTSATAAVQMLKGSLALAALLALAAVFAPVFLNCILYSVAFAGAGIAASASGQKQCGQLCRLYFEGTKLCASVLVLYFFMVFLSTAFLLISGNGG